MNPISLRLICRTSRCFPLTNTITHDITSTTQVRMAVPRLDSTPSMPILPKIAVKLANTAEPSAKSSQRLPGPFCAVPGFFSIIRIVPAPISTVPAPFASDMPSPNSTAASKIVSTVLDLSTGTTLFTSPSCSALK